MPARLAPFPVFSLTQGMFITSDDYNVTVEHSRNSIALVLKPSVNPQNFKKRKK
jgi:hypothetical protein